MNFCADQMKQTLYQKFGTWKTLKNCFDGDGDGNNDVGDHHGNEDNDGYAVNAWMMLKMLKLTVITMMWMMVLGMVESDGKDDIGDDSDHGVRDSVVDSNDGGNDGNHGDN